MKQLNVLEARRHFYHSGGSALQRLRELMPTHELRISADSLRSGADFVANQHNIGFCPPGTYCIINSANSASYYYYYDFFIVYTPASKDPGG